MFPPNTPRTRIEMPVFLQGSMVCSCILYMFWVRLLCVIVVFFWLSSCVVMFRDCHDTRQWCSCKCKSVVSKQVQPLGLCTEWLVSQVDKWPWRIKRCVQSGSEIDVGESNKWSINLVGSRVVVVVFPERSNGQIMDNFIKKKKQLLNYYCLNSTTIWLNFYVKQMSLNENNIRHTILQGDGYAHTANFQITFSERIST